MPICRVLSERKNHVPPIFLLGTSQRLSSSAHTLERVHHSGTVALIECPLDNMKAGRRSKASWICALAEQIHTPAEEALRQTPSSQSSVRVVELQDIPISLAL
jgi:hypothetical protein